MVEFLHWRIYSGCVYFIYPCLCSYPKLEGFVSSLLSPQGSWGRVGGKPLVAPWGAPVSVTYHLHPKSMGNPVILGTNSTPGTRGGRPPVSAEPLDASTPPQQPVLARIAGLMCETPVWDQHHLHLASLWPSSTKSGFFFFPFSFGFLKRGQWGSLIFCSQVPLGAVSLFFGEPLGLGVVLGPWGRHKIPGLGGLGLVLEPPWAFLSGIPAELWLCSDIQGGRESSGGLCPSRAILVLPVRIIPVFVCLEQRTTSGITNYWLFLGGGDKFCFFHDFLWLTLAVKLFCSTAKVYFGIEGCLIFWFSCFKMCNSFREFFF